MGGYVARHGLVPDRVLCSPSRRTRETLAGMAPQWPPAVKAVYEDRLYAATPKAIELTIRRTPSCWARKARRPP